MHHEIGTLRAEMHHEIGTLRTEMHTEFGRVRSEMHHEIGALRAEMHQGFREMRNDLITFMENSRKWRNQKAQLALLATSVIVSVLGIVRG
jgi:hypothetical protein